MRYMEFLSALKGNGAGWNQTYQQQWVRISNLLSPDLLRAAGLCAGSELPLPSDLATLQKRFYAVEQCRSLPSQLRDEAVAFSDACAIYKPSRSTADAGATCLQCWRTDHRRLSSAATMFSQCHVHQTIDDVGARNSPTGARKPRCLTPELLERNTARREVAYSKKLLKLAPQQKLFPIYSNRPITFYPKWHERGCHPEHSEAWLPWMKRRFPLVVKAVREVGRAEILRDAQETISFLERRSLKKWEEELYSDKSTWLFPIAKCDAWLDLEQHRPGRRASSSKQKRAPAPDYWHLLLAGQFLLKVED